MRPYPPFVPPTALADRTPREWSRPEAERYRVWLLSVLESRVTNLFDYLSVSRHGDHVQQLWLLGAKANALFPSRPFSARAEGDAIPALTPSGYALAADLGLAVAERLQAAHPQVITWATLYKPKAESRYHLPVLLGFRSGLFLEPVTGSVAEAGTILREGPKPDAWTRIFQYWSAQAAA